MSQECDKYVLNIEHEFGRRVWKKKVLLISSLVFANLITSFVIVYLIPSFLIAYLL